MSLDVGNAENYGDRELWAVSTPAVRHRSALGQSEEALGIARAVAEAREANPALGPSHPDTPGRQLVQILDES